MASRVGLHPRNVGRRLGGSPHCGRPPEFAAPGACMHPAAARRDGLCLLSPGRREQPVVRPVVQIVEIKDPPNLTRWNSWTSSPARAPDRRGRCRDGTERLAGGRADRRGRPGLPPAGSAWSARPPAPARRPRTRPRSAARPAGNRAASAHLGLGEPGRGRPWLAVPVRIGVVERQHQSGRAQHPHRLPVSWPGVPGRRDRAEPGPPSSPARLSVQHESPTR